MPKAYSYLRFSTPEQAKGDSQRRQEQLAQNYAAKHGLELDNSLGLRDLGKSAFRGANVEEGALGRFLEAIREGRVERGSFLLVEALDRLSRQTPREALPIFLSIVNAGVTIVTLQDEKVHSAETIDSSGFSIFESLIKMQTAHEESVKKSQRLGAVWENKRRRAADGHIVTGRLPEWLQKSPDGSSIIPIPERVAVVERIFNMATEGYGKRAIADTLQAEGVPTFSARAARWQESYISKILTNRAVLGEYQPHKRIPKSEGSKGGRVPDGEPVPNYFPAIIEPAVFQAAALQRAARRTGQVSSTGRKGKRFSNLFQGIGVCSCGGSMVYRNKGTPPKGGRYLYCSMEKGIPGFKYDLTEAHILLALRGLDLSALVGNRQTALQEKRAGIHKMLMDTKHALEDVSKAVGKLLAAIETTDAPPALLVQRLDAQAQEQGRLREQVQELEASLAAVDSDIFNAESAASDFIQLLAEVAGGCMSLPDDEAYRLRLRLNGLLKRELERIEFHHGGELVSLIFKSGNVKDVLISKGAPLSLEILGNLKGATKAGH